jgi:predicted DNA binding CopG/RHH family protein
MLVGKKSTILTVAIPNDLMEVIKSEAERKKVGYSTLIRMIVAEALSKGGDTNAKG